MLRRYVVVALVALTVTAGAACTQLESILDPTPSAPLKPAATPTPILEAAVPTPTALPTPSLTEALSRIAAVPGQTDSTSGTREGSAIGGGFIIALDGSEPSGFVQSFSGGNIRGEVAIIQSERDNAPKKHLSGISYEPFTIEVGMGMSKGFYEWISSSFDTGYVTRSGEMIACDLDGNCASVRQFTDAYISEVTMPALDGSSKEPAYMTVKFDPERIIYTEDSDTKITGNVAQSTDTAAKQWLTSNFRFEIGDLPTTRVTKIDSFTWKQAVIQDEVGAFRDPVLGSALAEVPNLRITISMADVKAWQDWHTSFVIEGRASDADELTGRIVFLGPDLQEELASINLLNVGIIALETTGQEASKEALLTFTVEVYVERMEFIRG